MDRRRRVLLGAEDILALLERRGIVEPRFDQPDVSTHAQAAALELDQARRIRRGEPATSDVLHG